MNNGQDGKRNPPLRIVTHPNLRTTAAFFWLSSLLLCSVFLILNVEVGRAQGQPLELKKSEGDSSRFRVERTMVIGGGELLTIWVPVLSEPTAIPAASPVATQVRPAEIPLLTVLRDTLGDDNRENDVLREVWVHGYAPPKLAQQAAAFVPFLYRGMSVKPRARLTSPPRAFINLSDTTQPVWRRLLVSGVTKALIDQPFLKASVHNYQRNVADYRKSNLMKALTVLSLYGSQPVLDSSFSEVELDQMQSQLALTEKTFGSLVDNINFPTFHERQSTAFSDTRGHNWELLRQQAEASGLYFEPLCLSDNAFSHALLWFPTDGLRNKASIDQPFKGRFLNIKNPWRDQTLRQWRGNSEKKYFDGENRVLSVKEINGPDGRVETMIPSLFTDSTSKKYLCC